jgi:hypothetical protein
LIITYQAPPNPRPRRHLITCPIESAVYHINYTAGVLFNQMAHIKSLGLEIPFPFT